MLAIVSDGKNACPVASKFFADMKILKYKKKKKNEPKILVAFLLSTIQLLWNEPNITFWYTDIASKIWVDHLNGHKFQLVIL